MAPAIISSVDTFTEALRGLLSMASEVGHNGQITRPLDKSHFGDRINHIGETFGKRTVPTLQAQYAAIETASRNILYELIVGKFFLCALQLLTPTGYDLNRQFRLWPSMESPRYRYTHLGCRYVKPKYVHSAQHLTFN